MRKNMNDGQSPTGLIELPKKEIKVLPCIAVPLSGRFKLKLRKPRFAPGPTKQTDTAELTNIDQKSFFQSLADMNPEMMSGVLQTTMNDWKEQNIAIDVTSL